ncbi:hypothetical protein ACFZAD_11975 [Streptomyces iakyrus]|uniref:hypothetical protein n=1 Tax=Streptomyces iakyrus TaxID=68219 RepID=UPI0036EC057E
MGQAGCVGRQAEVVDALSVRNNQTGGAEVRFWGPTYSYRALADGNIYNFPDHATYDFNRLDIC